MTPDQRTAARYRETRQWEKARGHHTGPKTPEGKLKAARRGLKHGERSREAEARYAWLASVKTLVARLDSACAEGADPSGGGGVFSGGIEQTDGSGCR